ncbi:sporulation integral membrane protein YlbJ [Intestinibacter bartlettii]|uniref:Sporulation integral membrane protein YlbJ n=1 Tax=Intestinibacter bartlettii TaxID=261299 RepID=A0ABS6DTT6_9FIRM|nr:sporulation integral membrane protein YlbJ [Intestinibacter bartlettii]MBU5335179.1 sporulation integral membrane protein YlbJ [Intestinibacter bartlettii]MDO5010148.1 sporulation integral membrane protein YlbJ [Intestinibacter bartlettii]
MKLKKLIAFFVPKLIICLIILGIILAPKSAISAAKGGISIWINILMPSLLPFIIGANLIVSLKIVDILGILINPLTQKIFNVSGRSGLIFAISMVSGYPVGSKFASQLRLENKISKYEGQRLVSFCSTSGPLFIIGSVGTGMLKNPHIGYIMLLCHYLASLAVGILFRNYGKEKSIKTKNTILKDINNIIYDESKSEGFFVLFGRAVVDGVNTLLAIGGFVIMFSVFFEILKFFKVIDFISYLMCIFLAPFSITPDIVSAFLSGLFEMTIGCNNLSQISNISFTLLVPLCSFLVAFSGLSILAQCSSFIAKTDIKVNLYIFAKFLHGLFAGIFTYLFILFNKSNLVSTFLVESTNYTYYDLYIDNFTPLLIVILLIYLFTRLRDLSS